MFFKKNNDTHKRQAQIRRVGPLITNVITPVCQQNGFIQARILLEWEYIVTPQFAQLCTPLKVTFPFKQRDNGCLILQTTSSMATEISYLEPMILSRINQYFGYQAIKRLSVFQGPISQKKSSSQKPRKNLDESTLSSLANQVENIDNERLRHALLNLGTSISQEEVN